MVEFALLILVLMWAMGAYGASSAAFDTARSPGDCISMRMTNAKIYKGTLLDVDANGYVLQIADTDALFFAGVAAETIDNSAGSAGDKEIRVWVSGEFEFKIAAALQSDTGKLAFCQLGSADAGQTVKGSTDGVNPVVVGRISRYVSATRVRVRIDGFALGAGAAPNGIHS
ncbi:MAG: hypothetical protein B7Z62_00330 [Deltaproteobacteria bacterium 37-65-8]|nr:MAG: hypothetical protein B7Z62_00330 [Deltaproteobacteria bacterium 37-65-8]